MSAIAVFFDKPGQDGYPFDQKDYRLSYAELSREIEAHGSTLWIVRTQESYLGGNRFTDGWVYENGELKKVDDPIEADLIFNRGNLIWDSDARVINEAEIEQLCTDKPRTYELFPAHSPSGRVVNDRAELESALAELAGELLVAKPLNKHGGEGVKIATREEILLYVQEFPYIIQEFIDTSAGIPGIMSEYHDLRIASVSGIITHCYYRTPPKGSLLANVAQGGEMHFLAEQDIPGGAMGLFREIDSYMSRYPERIYSVDMGRNSDGRWMIIEMNSKPGMLPRYYDEGTVKFQTMIAALLTRLAATEKSTN